MVLDGDGLPDDFDILDFDSGFGGIGFPSLTIDVLVEETLQEPRLRFGYSILGQVDSINLDNGVPPEVAVSNISSLMLMLLGIAGMALFLCKSDGIGLFRV